MPAEAIISLVSENKTGPGVDAAKRDIEGVGGSAQSVLSAIAGPATIAAGAITAVAGAAIATTFAFAQQADELSKLSQRTGVQAETLSGLRHAFDQSDLSAEQLEQTFARLNTRVLGLGERSPRAVEAIAALGLNIDELAARRPEEAFEVIAESISRVEGAANQGIIAASIFGEELGPRLLTLLQGGSQGLREFQAEAEALGIVIGQDTADQAARFNDVMDSIGKTFTGFRNTIGEVLLPILLAIAEEVLPALKVGFAVLAPVLKVIAGLIGGLIRGFFNLLKGAGQLLSGLAPVWNAIVKVVETAINGILSVIEAGVNLGIDLFNAFGKGIVGVFEGVANAAIGFHQALIDLNPNDNRVLDRASFDFTGIERVSFGRVSLGGGGTVAAPSIPEPNLGAIDIGDFAGAVAAGGGGGRGGGARGGSGGNVVNNVVINNAGSVVSEDELEGLINRIGLRSAGGRQGTGRLR